MPTLWYIRYSRSYLYIQHLCVGHPELELDTVDKLCDMIIASNPHIINIGQRLMKSLPLS